MVRHLCFVCLIHRRRRHRRPIRTPWRRLRASLSLELRAVSSSSSSFCRRNPTRIHQTRRRIRTTSRSGRTPTDPYSSTLSTPPRTASLSSLEYRLRRCCCWNCCCCSFHRRSPRRTPHRRSSFASSSCLSANTLVRLSPSVGVPLSVARCARSASQTFR